MNYYCLIAGLPDLQTDDSKVALSVAEIKREFSGELTPEDQKLLNLLFAGYDNINFLAYLENREAVMHPAASLNADDWNELIQLMKEKENPVDDRLMPYILTFFNHLNKENADAESISKEDFLATLYYDYAMKCKNEFLSKWFEFNLNLNNLFTALTCRKHGIDQKLFIIGNNETAHALRNSNARDFGLTGVFDELEQVLRIAEESDLFEREKKIDALKWAWLEENTFFRYFGIEKVLAFVLKVEMIERWKMLSVEKGAQIFRNLLMNMKEGVNFENQTY